MMGAGPKLGAQNLAEIGQTIADRDAGRRNLWLRTLDRLGLGFDS